MKLAKILIAVACVVALSTVSNVFAQSQGLPPCCGGAGGTVWGDLSQEQQKEMASLRTEFFKKLEATRSEIAQKRVEMLDLASKDKADEEAIEKKRQEIWSLQDSLRSEGRSIGSKIRTLLTPEQRQKLGPFGPGMGPEVGGERGCGGCSMGPGLGRGRGCGGCGGRISSL
jgi:Spy/CpxP family protein refolding chaperone